MDTPHNTVDQKRISVRNAKKSTKLNNSIHGKSLDAAFSPSNGHLAAASTSASSSSKSKATVNTSRMDKFEKLVLDEIREINQRLTNEVSTLKDFISERTKSGTAMAGNDTGASESDFKAQMNTLEQRLVNMNNEVDKKIEGLVELVKQLMCKQSGSDSSLNVVDNAGMNGALDGNGSPENGNIETRSRVEIIENKLNNLEGGLSSIKDTLNNISTKLQSNDNALPYASVVGRQQQ